MLIVPLPCMVLFGMPRPNKRRSDAASPVTPTRCTPLARPRTQHSRHTNPVGTHNRAVNIPP